MTDHLNMTNGHPGKLLLQFALPLMFGNIFQQLYTVVDTAIVGRGVGMEALAALGTVDWMNWMFLGIAQGFSQGFSVPMSQKFGQGDTEGLRRSIGSAARLTAMIALVVTAFAQVFLGVFLKLLQVPEHLWARAELYSRILLAGIPAMLFFNFCASVLRAVGDSKTPLRAMATAAITNIVLDCLAVFVLGWGIAGAAAATVFSQCLSGVLCAVKIAKTPVLRITKAHIVRDSALSKRLMSLGVPVAFQNIIISVGGMAVQSVVNHFDTSFIAGFTATGKLYGILEIAAISYGYAVTTYTGQNYGAALWKRIRNGVHWAAAISLATSVLIAGVMIFFGRELTMLFISAETQAEAAAAGETAYRYLFIMSIFLPVLYLLFVYRSALQGMGDTFIPMLSGVVEFVMRVGFAVFIGMSDMQSEIFYAEALAWIGATVLLSAAYYYRQAKLGKELSD